ncbi:MAG: YbhB/YbcL family Raf kinase inhibitor-like protein [Azospirillaceae bacterium]|nr:YbhB/YbcL family Raf kinase inhibitor-like protein [Azospirillaceae bacterium]
MQISSNSFSDGGRLPDAHAFAVTSPFGRVRPGPNRNPHIAWSDPPAGTRSFVLTMHSPDAPSLWQDANREGRTLSPDLPRVPFHHWILLDIPLRVREIKEGRHSAGIVNRGKPGPAAPEAGLRHGLNDLTVLLQEDWARNGDYYGYDGPNPPWNDSIFHRYIFTIHALDIPRLPLMGPITATATLLAMTGHVLERASMVAGYSLNPALLGT